MPRLFTALEIPSEIGQSLSLLRGGLPGARWITPENYHLTLRFIGDIDDALAREIAYMLGQVKRPALTCGSTASTPSAAISRAPWWQRSRRSRNWWTCKPITSA